MIQTPFYPMRPMMGEKLTAGNILPVVNYYRSRGYEIQRKLNGDRAIMEVTRNDGVIFWNRYGSRYSFSVNAAPFKGLLIGTILDGENYQGTFYPFEQISTVSTTTERIRDCRLLCGMIGVPYIYGEVTNDWLMVEFTLPPSRTRMWEGVVCKMKHRPYQPLKTADQESPEWVKLKW